MNIDELVVEFNDCADVSSIKLREILCVISEGKVPSEQDCADLDEVLIKLRSKYENISRVAEIELANDELPDEGCSVSTYYDAIKNSKSAKLRKKVYEVEKVLLRFLSVKSLVERYTKAIAPIQKEVEILLDKIKTGELTDFGEILRATAGPELFMKVLDRESLDTNDDDDMLDSLEYDFHFHSYVIRGLLKKNYYVSDVVSKKFETEDVMPLIQTELEYSGSVFEDNEIKVGTNDDSNSDNGVKEGTCVNNTDADIDAIDENISESEEIVTEGVVSEIPIVKESVLSDDRMNSITVVDSDLEYEDEFLENILKASNKLKTGKPSASSFKKEIVKIGKFNKEVRILLPLFTNLGVLSKEQCFLFSVCMDCIPENDQAREAINSAIDALVSKGYVGCFDYENNGEKIIAYCLSDYCDRCIRKDSISSQMKGFWTLSFGNHRFHTKGMIKKDDLYKVISNNEALLRYVYSVKATSSKDDYDKVKSSITWKGDHYQVAVVNDGKVYSCRLIMEKNEIENIVDNHILVCAEKCDMEVLCNISAEYIFIVDKGSVRRIGNSEITAEEVVSIENVKESTDIEEVQMAEESLLSSTEGTLIPEVSNTPQFDENKEIMNSKDDLIGSIYTATTPMELMHKTGRPSDEEFCNIICRLLNTEVTTQNQLRTAIINSSLLAYSAELEGKYAKSSELSLQLRLATNTFIEPSLYTSENLTTAFSSINSGNASMALAAYMFAMLVPAIPFDYGLKNQTEMVFSEYNKNFIGLNAFKSLFNKLMSVKDASVTGFSPTSIALLGSNARSENFIEELKKQANQYLTIQIPKTRMKQLPILYNDCFGAGSDLYECMSIIANNNTESLECVQMILSELCDVQNEVYVLNVSKMEECLNSKWNAKNDFRLAYDAHGQALKQFKVRLEVMKEWYELVIQSKSSNKDISRLKKLKTEILESIESIQKDSTWKHIKHSNVLFWMLQYMQKYLAGELVKIEIYSDLLFTGVFSLDDEGVPIIDKSMTEIKFYEPWRNALRHITADKKTAEEVKSEIRGDVLIDTDEETAGLKDNLHQLLLLGRFLKSEDEDFFVSEEYIEEAIEYADECITKFKETLELAYTYNQINETEKETILGIMANYQRFFYETKDFANWRRFLDALELQIKEYAACRKKELRAKLDERLSHNLQSSLLKEADRLLEKDENFAVTEEYLTRFDSGEIEFEDVVILHDKDYFGEFLKVDNFDEIMRICSQGKGRALKNFGWDYVESKIKDWTSRNKEDSKALIQSWPSRKDTVTSSQIQILFSGIGFTVINAERKTEYKEDLFTVSVKPTARSMADYRHPIASFGTQIKKTINVILIDANYTPRQLVDSVSSLDLGGISIVIYNQPMNAAGRRMIGEIFHTQTSGQNPFLLLDQVLFLYLASHQITERIPAFLKCTLPYTTYQPFVRDGGSTADEMFCGRARELATIIDPNGACVVYGGRQLGKTALLERAESRCSKPNNKEYAVYSTIIRIDNEKDVVDTLTIDIDRKTNGKVIIPKCNTLKELCSHLSKMFRCGQIASMYLFIDEVDCFLAAIADKKYTPIQPLVDLKRETRNNFKFVLTGLHNVCRAKNATQDNGVFGQLGTPLCIKPLSPTDALKLLSRPLNYLGFQIDRYPHLETILTNTNYYPGILQFFGYMLVETLNSQYEKYYSATDGNPPFSLQDEQLGAVMNSADLNKSIKDKFRWSLELDKRYFMIARCITMLYHYNEEERTTGSWMGFKVQDILEMSKEYDIHCLENEHLDSFINLLDEMVDMGILSQPMTGYYRLRRSSFVDIIGENIDILDRDIVNNNEVIA